MDFTIVAGVLGALLLFIPALTTFLNRVNRLTRVENRKLRKLQHEYDVHLFLLEREGWTKHGARPPARPKLLQEVPADDDADQGDAGAPPGRAGEVGPPAGAGPRHASGEG